MIQRVLVVGTSGAGKSTMGKRIAAKLDLPFHATDPYYWLADWHPAPIEQVDRCLDQVLQDSAWVMDGNFEHRWRDVWGKTDCIIWLDYGLVTVLWQVFKRNLVWMVGRKVVWSNNRMTFRRVLSGVLHAFRTHAGKRRRYPQYFAQLEGPTVLRFRCRHDALRWLSGLGA